ncbi:hypothetical protein BVRB_5g108200 [Beta vulgaris subsp. vulgaris]|nr:hypothetical protein BVRB_5g108200 [Beta vulgaris subsp. vulgaris]
MISGPESPCAAISPNHPENFLSRTHMPGLLYSECY